MLVRDLIDELRDRNPDENVVQMVVDRGDFDSFTPFRDQYIWDAFVHEWEGQKWNKDAFMMWVDIAETFLARRSAIDRNVSDAAA